MIGDPLRLSPFAASPVEHHDHSLYNLASRLIDVGVDEFSALSTLKARVRFQFLVHVAGVKD